MLLLTLVFSKNKFIADYRLDRDCSDKYPYLISGRADECVSSNFNIWETVQCTIDTLIERHYASMTCNLAFFTDAVVRDLHVCDYGKKYYCSSFEDLKLQFNMKDYISVVEYNTADGCITNSSFAYYLIPNVNECIYLPLRYPPYVKVINYKLHTYHDSMCTEERDEVKNGVCETFNNGFGISYLKVENGGSVVRNGVCLLLCLLLFFL